MKKAVRKKRSVRKTRAKARPLYTQRGKSKIFILLVIVVVIAVIGGGGFLFLSQKSGGGLPVPVLKTYNPNCDYHDPELCKFMNNWQNQKDYSVTTTSTMGGMNIESLMEVSGDDKTHMVSKENGKENSNIISIGNTTYTLDYSDNKWWKYTPEKQTTTPEPEQQMKDEVMFDDKKMPKDTTTYKFITKEPCGDNTCLKYQIVDSTSTDTTQYIWFDNSEYLMRKLSIEDKSGGVSKSMYYYGGINISVPSPVKEGMPGASSGMPNNADIQKMMQQYQQQSQDQQNQPAMTQTPDNSGSDQNQPQDDSSSGY